MSNFARLQTTYAPIRIARVGTSRARGDGSSRAIASGDDEEAEGERRLDQPLASLRAQQRSLATVGEEVLSFRICETSAMRRGRRLQPRMFIDGGMSSASRIAAP